ncbi:MAG: flavodoxin [Endomicrobiaceae bacterium]
MPKKLLKFFLPALICSIIFIYSYKSESYADEISEKNIHINTLTDFGKVLVVYYSLSGNTKNIANKIKERTNADIYEIKTVNKYPPLPFLYITAKSQMNPKNYPKLQDKLPDFSQYDMVFIGSPVWWYTIASPVLSFLSQADFQGKSVVPFATHGGKYGSFFEDFAKKAKNANVIDGKDFKKVNKEKEDSLNDKITNWLKNLSSEL